ncbi:27222_t:CDS:1, partial [Dentiscutata erythropus]
MTPSNELLLSEALTDDDFQNNNAKSSHSLIISSPLKIKPDSSIISELQKE